MLKKQEVVFCTSIKFIYGADAVVLIQGQGVLTSSGHQSAPFHDI